ncbi:MAG TPA: polyamine aminopropyltransferase [Blastocatellia bacterium]|jgi:spermidine synthase|nr:polyamine aminopropyltransferase [Blastocatellia bacterium]
MLNNRTPILFLNVLIIATCGLVYELLAGTVASYVLGDSVTQFSLIIGIYLFAMGAGAWVSRFIESGLARKFIEVELGVALLGGLSAPLLFLSFARLSYFQVVLYGVVFVIGLLVGLELPLLMRILKDELDFKDLVSRVLTFDYIGALLASLLFPLFLIPRLGLVRTSLVFGLLNAGVGLWATWFMRPLIKGGVNGLRVRGMIAILLLSVGIVKSTSLTRFVEDDGFADEIIYSRTTPYQRIVVTRGKAGFQLFLNGRLQFSSSDEYRYHEALVHPAMMLAGAPRRVLVLGGGDGLAVREILRHPSVESVTVVDLDPAMTELSQALPPLADLNNHSFSDPRVRVVNQDAMIWIEEVAEQFDAAIVDFPDPSSFALGKLYTTRFYRLLKSRLTPDAAVAVQCTSPLFAPQSYWCILRTMETAGFTVKPYQTTVPSFIGVWGFAIARATPFDPPTVSPPGLRYLDDKTMAAIFILPADLEPVPVEINRLDNQALVRYHEAEWKKYD